MSFTEQFHFEIPVVNLEDEDCSMIEHTTRQDATVVVDDDNDCTIVENQSATKGAQSSNMNNNNPSSLSFNLLQSKHATSNINISSDDSEISQESCTSSDCHEVVTAQETNLNNHNTHSNNPPQGITNNPIVLDDDSEQESECCIIETNNIANLNEKKNYGILQEIIENCLNMEDSIGMSRIINRTLYPIYIDTCENFKKSDHFRRFLIKTLQKLEKYPCKKFSHIKELCEVMKSGIQSAKNSTNIKGKKRLKKKRSSSKNQTWGNIPEKKRKTDVVDLDNDDDDDDDIIINNNDTGSQTNNDVCEVIENTSVLNSSITENHEDAINNTDDAAINELRNTDNTNQHTNKDNKREHENTDMSDVTPALEILRDDVLISQLNTDIQTKDDISNTIKETAVQIVNLFKNQVEVPGNVCDIATNRYSNSFGNINTHSKIPNEHNKKDDTDKCDETHDSLLFVTTRQSDNVITANNDMGIQINDVRSEAFEEKPVPISGAYTNQIEIAFNTNEPMNEHNEVHNTNKHMDTDDVILVDDNRGCNKVNIPSNLDEKIKKKIARLEAQINSYNKLIEDHELKEVDLNCEEYKSPYILCDIYKSKVVRLYNRICKLTGSESVKWRKVRLKVVEGRHDGPVRCLEEFINSRIDKQGNPPFPDLADVVKCVQKANFLHQLCWSRSQIEMEAQALFIHYGRTVQKKRQKREWRHLMRYVKEEVVDPADADPGLQARLDRNAKLGEKKEKDLIDKYANMECIIGSSIEKDAIEFSESENETYEETILNNTSTPNSVTVPNCSTINNYQNIINSETMFNCAIVHNSTAVNNKTVTNSGVINSANTSNVIYRRINTTHVNKNTEGSTTSVPTNKPAVNNKTVPKSGIKYSANKTNAIYRRINTTHVNKNAESSATSVATNITANDTAAVASKNNTVSNYIHKNTEGRTISVPNNITANDTSVATSSGKTVSNNTIVSDSNALKGAKDSNIVQNTENIVIYNPADASTPVLILPSEVAQKPVKYIVVDENMRLVGVIAKPFSSDVNINKENKNNNLIHFSSNTEDSPIQQNNEDKTIENNKQVYMTPNLEHVLRTAPTNNNKVTLDMTDIRNLQSSAKFADDPVEIPKKRNSDFEITNSVSIQYNEVSTNSDADFTSAVKTEIVTENNDVSSTTVSTNLAIECCPILNNTEQSESTNNTCQRINTEANIDQGSINTDINDVKVKNEKLDISSMLEALGDNYSVSIISIEDPFEIIEISDSSDSDDDL